MDLLGSSSINMSATTTTTRSNDSSISCKERESICKDNTIMDMNILSSSIFAWHVQIVALVE